VLLAREFLGETHGIHRIDPSTLVEDEVTFLPLGALGSSDKITVRLVQEVAGVPVLGGSVNVLFDTSGRLLSIDLQALPELGAFPTAPALGLPAARRMAAALFEADAGVVPTLLGPGRLAIAMNEEGQSFQPRLVWEVNAQWQVPDFDMEGWYYRIDATSGELVQREPSVHNLFDVSGTVTSQVSPGIDPDNGTNSVNENMPYIEVKSPQGDAFTDLDGNFTIVGATEPVDVTISYRGTYADTTNFGPSTFDYFITTTLSAPSGNVITMNPTATEEYTAEANAFRWINLMREWTVTTNPADTTWVGFQAVANCNINSACNATWGGTAVNFFHAAGNCPNTAYSSLVLHEMGHWLNDIYGNGNNFFSGFGEGNADAFALYVLDDPIVGKDFFGPGNDLRDANDSNLWCGPGCYFTPHDNGEVLMGALWNVRTNLKNTHGVGPGGVLANTLFNSWMNAYDDGFITPLIELHWLVLDDDDGNIGNGTPNYQDIDDGFTQQAFPGFPLTSTYCTAGFSASGCQATISSIGTVSATAASGFDLVATGVEGSKDGIFFFAANGRQANPWGNGTSYQCVTPPVSRAGLLIGTGTTGQCDGAFSQDLNALWCPTCPKPNHNPGVAATVQAQLWYRDPMSTSNRTTSLSDAIEFGVAP
jgi:hypothetical protein